MTRKRKPCPRCGFNFEPLDAATREKLNRRVAKLSLNVRTANALWQITYVGELIQRSESELLKIKNFGRKSLTEIREVVDELGFRLGYGIDGWEPPKQHEPESAA